MQAVTVIEGGAAPLDRSDVDTDQIIPSEWLKRTERAGFGRGLFSEWSDEPSFVLNQSEYLGASILLAGDRFGTGSSREHAVWALVDYGFRAVVATSFGDIFMSNAVQSSLVTATVSRADLDELIALVRERPTTHLVVDLSSLLIEAPSDGRQWPFTISEATRERLVNGWDDVDLAMRHGNEIANFEAERDEVAIPAGQFFDAAGSLINFTD